MAGGEVFKEFVVSLGFSLDEASLRKFQEGLKNSDKAVGSFAGQLGGMIRSLATVGAALAGVAAGAARWADNVSKAFESAFYSAQRSSTTVAALQAIKYAFEQTGGSASDAVSQIQSLALAIKTNPGIESFINHLGVPTRDHGNLRDVAKIYDDLILKLKQMNNFPITSQIGEMLGINPSQLNDAINNIDARIRREKELAELQKNLGFDPDKAAKTAKEFEQIHRRLASTIGVIYDQVGTAIASVLLKPMRELDGWLNSHGEWIRKRASGANAKENFNLLRDGLGSIFKYLGLDNADKNVNALTGKGSTDPRPMDPLVSGFFEGLADSVTKGMKNAFDWLATHPPSLDPTAFHSSQGSSALLQPAAWVTGRFAPPPGPPASGGGSQPQGGGGYAPEPSGHGTIAERHNNPGNLRWAPGVPRSRGFAIFDSALNGFVAMGNLLHKYAKEGRDTVSSIISKWAPPSENDTGAYISNLARQLGVGANEHLNLNDPRIMSGLMNGIGKIEAGKRWWDQSTIDQAIGTLGEGGRRGRGGGINVAPNVNINVHGSGDPVRTAHEVARHQDRVFSDIARNLQPRAVWS